MKLSKPASEYLRDAIYRDTETWQDAKVTYAFQDHDNNAATRELIKAGAFDILPAGWSKVRIVTRDGWEHAATLQAARLRLMAGVPIAEYKLERGLPLNKPGLVAVKTAAGWWHTNGHLICAGEAVSTQLEGYGMKRLTPEDLRDNALKYLAPPRDAVACHAVAYQLFGRNNAVWFNRGQPMNSQYYSHVMRLFPDATWSVSGHAFFASVKGKAVASVMQFKADANDTVAAMMAESTRDIAILAHHAALDKREKRRVQSRASNANRNKERGFNTALALLKGNPGGEGITA